MSQLLDVLEVFRKDIVRFNDREINRKKIDFIIRKLREQEKPATPPASPVKQGSLGI